MLCRPAITLQVYGSSFDQSCIHANHIVNMLQLTTAFLQSFEIREGVSIATFGTPLLAKMQFACKPESQLMHENLAL